MKTPKQTKKTKNTKAIGEVIGHINRQKTRLKSGIFTAVFTVAVESQAAVGNFHIECLFNGLLYFLNPGITKLKHIPTFNADKMIVLLEFVRLFILGRLVAKLMLGNKAAVLQEFNCVVKRGAAHTVPVIFHPDVKRFNIKMTFRSINLTEDGKSFRGFTVSMLTQVFYKNPFNRFKILSVNFFCF
jgi:hypothetical protein